MAGIDSNSSNVGFKKSSTWNTETAITSTGAMRLRCSALSAKQQINTFTGRDIGAGRKMTATTREEVSLPVSVACDSTYGQSYLAFLAAVMGTEGSATETTVGQSDYSHTFDLADNVYNSNKIIWSLGWTTEDATYLRVIPSVKFGGFTFQSDVNKVGTWTFRGLGDRIVDSGATTTNANLAALSNSTDYEFAPLGGSGLYFRINTSSGGSLSSGDNKDIEYVSVELNRNFVPEYSARGASSGYILEPREQGFIIGKLTVRFREIAEGTQAIQSWIENQTKLKAELFYSGATINSGVATSFKFQFPYMEIEPADPDGYDIANNSSLMKPTVTFNLLKASAAPTGMTGVTDYLRITAIDRRATKWTA